MKKKILLYILIVVVFSVGFFLLGWFLHQLAPISTSTSTVNLKVEKSETARLYTDGHEIKILTNSYFFGLHFVFLDSETNDIANTLSIQNQARDFPSYRIVNGHTHDWLVVTRMGSWGTGLQYDYDEWYILSYSGNMKMVLSYKSGGNEVFLDGSTNKYWRTEILNDGYADDSAVDVKFIEKICSTTEDGGDKECSETSKITHYMWNESKEEFILKNTIK